MADIPYTLLLVEDNALLADLEVRQLTSLGYCVVHVSTGEAAIDLVFNGSHAIDLILMDIELDSPMNGLTVAKIILSTFDIPLIFLASHTDRAIIDLAEKISPYGCVPKTSGVLALSSSIKLAFKLHDALLGKGHR